MFLDDRLYHIAVDNSDEGIKALLKLMIETCLCVYFETVNESKNDTVIIAQIKRVNTSFNIASKRIKSDLRIDLGKDCFKKYLETTESGIRLCRIAFKDN